jgi:hypothetical protein
MDKILISEINRYLDIMGISQKRLITEQAGGLYDLIRSYLLPAFRKVRHIPATPNSYERYILDLEQGVSQTGERLTKEMELTPGEYNALWGRSGALRVYGAIDDFAELGLNDAGRSALFRLINNLLIVNNSDRTIWNNSCIFKCTVWFFHLVVVIKS